MPKFSYYKPEFTLRRNDVLLRLFENSDHKFISGLLLFRNNQDCIENRDPFLPRNRKYRKKCFFGLCQSKRNQNKRIKVRSDIVNWFIRRIPIT